jgi:hypothetical protein
MGASKMVDSFTISFLKEEKKSSRQYFFFIHINGNRVNIVIGWFLKIAVFYIHKFFKENTEKTIDHNSTQFALRHLMESAALQFPNQYDPVSPNHSRHGIDQLFNRLPASLIGSTLVNNR